MRLIAEHMTARLRAILRLLERAEDGFTMIAALGVMTVTSLLITTAFVAAEGDVNLTQRDLNNKRAYFAARGGVDEFLYFLKQNPNYWTECPRVDPPQPLPGTTAQDDLEYSYVPVPANGNANCINDNADTMIDDDTGTFRMRFTGTAGESSRSLVASFRRDSPLDFLWYTVYEVLDPGTQPDDPTTTGPGNNEQQNYRTLCEKFRRGPDGVFGNSDDRDNSCNINFIGFDFMKGPMFSQDQFSICGSPTFGRDSGDQIKSMGDPVEYWTGGCTGNAPGGPGERIENADLIDLPPANTALRDDALALDSVYQGPTRIEVLGGNTVRITNGGVSTETDVVNLPEIIYVEEDIAAGGCQDPSYTPYRNFTYALTGGCGNVYVSGQFSQPVTIAATNDIIIEGDLTVPNFESGAMIGLVAKNFVRVQHQVTTRIDRDPDGPGGPLLPNGVIERGECGNPNSNVSPSHTDIKIHAAILALQHSFIVDNYDCGTPLGELEIRGAIAQKFRGTVGTYSGGGSTILSGYRKDYEYDDRLATRMPPYLFDLQEASWRLERETICVLGGTDAATRCAA